MTSIESGPGFFERMNPRNWTLVWKLVAIGMVPALLALALGVLRVADQAGAAAEIGRSSRLLEVRETVAAAARALRQERNESSLFVAGNRQGDTGVLDIGFAETDGKIAEMVGAIRTTDELEEGTVSALQQVEGGLAQIHTLRGDAKTNAAYASNQMRERYTELIGRVDVLDRALLRQVRTPLVAGIADALTSATSASEQLAVQHTVLAAAIKSGVLRKIDVDAVSVTDNQLITDYREYQVALTPEQLRQFGQFLDDASNSAREHQKAAILQTPVDGAITLAPLDWDIAYNGSQAITERSTEAMRQELERASVSAEERASNLAGINSVVLMLGLLLGITIAVLVARALIRSLRVLRTAALDVAERRLPLAVESMRAGESPDVAVEPVPLSTHDEVGQVARAFDAVHGQAVRLAADQAALQSNVSAMFVNLSRRSQALVERQLHLIEALESNEQDPDQLSNLFQLDHLATRMRRNSENLLVLAGTDLAKRNVAPVPMVDVLRAAVSEVEQYQRIVVQTPPNATVVGRAANDIVHLLAELLDNATNFSPPDSQVVMSSTIAADGSIVVEIADRGVGMAEHELRDANQRLSGPSSVDVSASRRMGLFVVGRLGARHGIGVRLSTSAAGGPGGGLTASVTVPNYLIPTSEQDDHSPSRTSYGAMAGEQGARPSPAPAQRTGMNGSGRTGSLSALVAGADGPANPSSVFDTPSESGTPGTLFAAPPTNGSPPALPSRRPGSTLQPGGGPPRPPERPGPSEPSDAEQQKAREVAEQARRDQEAADKAAKAKELAAKQAREAEKREADNEGGPGNGTAPKAITPNGSRPYPTPVPLPNRMPSPTPLPMRTPKVKPKADESPDADDAPTGRQPIVPLPQQVRPRPSPAHEKPAVEAPKPAPVADTPPTTPMPIVGLTPPVEKPQAQPRPQPEPSTADDAQPEQAQQPVATPEPKPVPRAKARPAQRDDELFSPSVPVIAEPDPAQQDALDSQFDMGATTPIFEEIASAWFRSNRKVPVDWATDQSGGMGPGNAAAKAERGADGASAPFAGPPRPAPAPAPAPKPAPKPAPRPVPVAEPKPAPTFAPPAAESDNDFASAADDGWRAASGMESERPDELTAAGLPKRRPRARLIPGSAGSAVLAPPAISARSAETIRGRLASYQQGVRQGRARRESGAAGPDNSTKPASAGGTNDEERT